MSFVSTAQRPPGRRAAGDQRCCRRRRGRRAAVGQRGAAAHGGCRVLAQPGPAAPSAPSNSSLARGVEGRGHVGRPTTGRWPRAGGRRSRCGPGRPGRGAGPRPARCAAQAAPGRGSATVASGSPSRAWLSSAVARPPRTWSTAECSSDRSPGRDRRPRGRRCRAVSRRPGAARAPPGRTTARTDCADPVHRATGRRGREVALDPHRAVDRAGRGGARWAVGGHRAARSVAGPRCAALGPAAAADDRPAVDPVEPVDQHRPLVDAERLVEEGVAAVDRVVDDPVLAGQRR